MSEVLLLIYYGISEHMHFSKISQDKSHSYLTHRFIFKDEVLADELIYRDVVLNLESVNISLNELCFVMKVERNDHPLFYVSINVMGILLNPSLNSKVITITSSRSNSYKAVCCTMRWWESFGAKWMSSGYFKFSSKSYVFSIHFMLKGYLTTTSVPPKLLIPYGNDQCWIWWYIIDL